MVFYDDLKEGEVMKKILFFCVALMGLVCYAAKEVKPKLPEDWVLVFKEEFSGKRMNKSRWRLIPFVTGHLPDWKKNQSHDPHLFTFTGRTLKLWGRYGEYKTMSNPKGDKEVYGCAGLTTQGVFSFKYGRVDVRARMDCVQGCWPAIWLLPTKSPSGWPGGGEIDILEHLNHDNIVYQTLHFWNAEKKHGSCGVRPKVVESIKNNELDFHVYSVEWTKDKITFLVDGKVTGTFDRSKTPHWPFGENASEFYLIIDQQIGGGWVEGSGRKGIDKETLQKKGAVLEIDYVRVYSDPKYRPKKRSKSEKQK